MHRETRTRTANIGMTSTNSGSQDDQAIRGAVIEVDYENHIPLSKNRIESRLKENSGDSTTLGSFLKLLDATVHFQYHDLENELRADYEFFDPSISDEHRSKLKEDERKGRETRFLDNFIRTMEKGNFNPLTQQDFEVAEAEDYLFRLPVTMDWNGLDDGLLSDYFRERPSDDERPEFSNRLLIYRRGVGLDKTSARLIVLKLDLIIERLIVGILKLLSVFSFFRKRKFVSQTIEDHEEDHVAEQTTEDASNIHGKRTVERIGIKHTGGGIGWLFSKVDIQEPTFSELVLLFRLATKEGEPADHRIFVKTFRDIPMADMEVIFPTKKLSMQGVDLIKLIVTGLFGLIAIVMKLISAVLNPVVLLVSLGALGSYAAKVFVKYKSSKDRYQHLVTQSLYDKSLDNDRGVLFYLINSVESQEFKEASIGYCVLLEHGPCTESELDVACEKFLLDQFDVKVDFEVDDALQKLISLEIVTEANDKFTALPLVEARKKLDENWDGIFEFA